MTHLGPRQIDSDMWRESPKWQEPLVPGSNYKKDYNEDIDDGLSLFDESKIFNWDDSYTLFVATKSLKPLSTGKSNDQLYSTNMEWDVFLGDKSPKLSALGQQNNCSAVQLHSSQSENEESTLVRRRASSQVQPDSLKMTPKSRSTASVPRRNASCNKRVRTYQEIKEKFTRALIGSVSFGWLPLRMKGERKKEEN